MIIKGTCARCSRKVPALADLAAEALKASETPGPERWASAWLAQLHADLLCHADRCVPGKRAAPAERPLP